MGNDCQKLNGVFKEKESLITPGLGGAGEKHLGTFNKIIKLRQPSRQIH